MYERGRDVERERDRLVRGAEELWHAAGHAAGHTTGRLGRQLGHAVDREERACEARAVDREDEHIR